MSLIDRENVQFWKKKKIKKEEEDLPGGQRERGRLINKS